MQPTDPPGGLGQGGPGDQAGPSADPRDTGRAASQQGRPPSRRDPSSGAGPARRPGPPASSPAGPPRGETATERGEVPTESGAAAGRPPPAADPPSPAAGRAGANASPTDRR